jgi:hypothetical protein
MLSLYPILLYRLILCPTKAILLRMRMPATLLLVIRLLLGTWELSSLQSLVLLLHHHHVLIRLINHLLARELLLEATLSHLLHR